MFEMKLTVFCLFAALTAGAQSTEHLPVTDADLSRGWADDRVVQGSSGEYLVGAGNRLAHHFALSANHVAEVNALAHF